MTLKSFSMVLLLGICVVPLVECHGLTAPGGSGGTAKRYLTAAQRKDFKTIIDLTSSFQDSIQNIKRNNPQVLWTKLIGQYYDDQAKNLVHDPLLTLVPENAQWSITEQRPVGTNQTTVYATVRYATPADSPIIGQQRLKQGILQLNIFNTTQQVLGVGRVEAADTYWPIPTLNNEEVIQLIKAQLPEMALFPYIRCDFKSPAEPGGIPYCTIRMPQGTTPWLSEYKAFYERQGFVLKPFKISEGWGANEAEAQPPQTWSAFLLPNKGQQIVFGRGTVGYRLPESTEMQVDSIQPNSVSAKATFRLIHSGCTAACGMLREYWKLEIQKHIVGNTDPFFLARWRGAGNEDPLGVEGAKWPTEETRSFDFLWNASSLSWKVANSTEVSAKY